jgi:hypothetical protein
MTRTTRKLTAISLAAVAGTFGLFASEDFLLARSDQIVTDAQARIGRPLTPLSYAGVARRTTRRAVGAGVAVGVTVGPRCTQIVDAYGRVITRCY